MIIGVEEEGGGAQGHVIQFLIVFWQSVLVQLAITPAEYRDFSKLSIGSPNPWEVLKWKSRQNLNIIQK